MKGEEENVMEKDENDNCVPVPVWRPPMTFDRRTAADGKCGGSMREGGRSGFRFQLSSPLASLLSFLPCLWFVCLCLKSVDKWKTYSYRTWTEIPKICGLVGGGGHISTIEGRETRVLKKYTLYQNSTDRVKSQHSVEIERKRSPVNGGVQINCKWAEKRKPVRRYINQWR